MYLLKLVFRNIIKMYRESRAIFLYISFGIIAAVFGILFYSGYLMSYFSSGNAVNELSIDISPEQSRDSVVQIVSEIMDESSFKSINLYSGNTRSFGGISVTGMYDASAEKRMGYGEIYDKYETGSYAVVSDSVASQLGITGVLTGRKIVYDGREYEITGMYSWPFDIFIPPLCFTEIYDVRRIDAEFNEKLTDEFLLKLKEYDLKYSVKNNSNIFNSGDFVFSFVIVVLIFSVSFLNILVMFSFWKTRMKNTFTAYHICGCKESEKMILVTGIVAVTMLINSFTGLAAFMLLFRKLVEFEVVADLPLKNYMLVFACIVFLLMAYAVVFGAYSSKTAYSRDGKERI